MSSIILQYNPENPTEDNSIDGTVSFSNVTYNSTSINRLPFYTFKRPTITSDDVPFSAPIPDQYTIQIEGNNPSSYNEKPTESLVYTPDIRLNNNVITIEPARIKWVFNNEEFSSVSLTIEPDKIITGQNVIKLQYTLENSDVIETSEDFFVTSSGTVTSNLNILGLQTTSNGFEAQVGTTKTVSVKVIDTRNQTPVPNVRVLCNTILSNTYKVDVNTIISDENGIASALLTAGDQTVDSVVVIFRIEGTDTILNVYGQITQSQTSTGGGLSGDGGDDGGGNEEPPSGGGSGENDSISDDDGQINILG